MNKAVGLKQQAIGRSDLFQMDPRQLHIKEDWNSRDFDTPENKEHVAELAASIAKVGVKQPLTVYVEDGKVFISDGECRLRACRLVIENGGELKSVPVRAEDRYADEADRVFSQIVRNGGKQFTPYEQAKTFKRLIDLGWSETDIAERAGKSRVYVVNLLKLKAAPDAVQKLVREGSVSPSLAMESLRTGRVENLTATVEAAKAAAPEGKVRVTRKDVVKRDTMVKIVRTEYDRLVSVDAVMNKLLESGKLAQEDFDSALNEIKGA